MLGIKGNSRRSAKAVKFYFLRGTDGSHCRIKTLHHQTLTNLEQSIHSRIKHLVGIFPGRVSIRDGNLSITGTRGQLLRQSQFKILETLTTNCSAESYYCWLTDIGFLSQIDNAEINAVMATTMAKADGVADQFNVAKRYDDYDAMLADPEIDAVILATPTQMHAEQGIKAMEAGKHVLVEIPMADSLEDSEKLVAVQEATGMTAMAGHVRRFNPSHQYVHNMITEGKLTVQQMDVQTYFFRRTNMNAKGEPRSWTDHLLWHHACHTIDLFMYQTGEMVTEVHAVQGPKHPDLGIAMDMWHDNRHAYRSKSSNLFIMRTNSQFGSES